MPPYASDPYRSNATALTNLPGGPAVLVASAHCFVAYASNGSPIRRDSRVPGRGVVLRARNRHTSNTLRFSEVGIPGEPDSPTQRSEAHFGRA
jgi:hypothetical protein